MGAAIATGADFELTAAPGVHHVPVIGVRARDLNGGIAVYSADGEPSSGLQALAQGADLLVHEATGEFNGHSSAIAAAKLAHAARVRRLILIHLAQSADNLEAQRQVAAAVLQGEVILANDLDGYPF
jgi:ribonuclease Z